MELRSEKGPGALAQPRYSVGLWFEPRVVSQIRCDPKAREHFRWIEIHLPMQGEDRQASGVDRPLALPFGDGHEVELALACSVFQHELLHESGLLPDPFVCRPRSDGRRVGTEGVRSVRYWGSQVS